jgi:UDP-glucose 4-epimerase
MMGPAAPKTAGLFGREVGVEEAKQRVRDAVSAGLVPLVGKARLDNFLFGIRDPRLLSVCFCCDCCCITSMYAKMPLDAVEAIFPRLDGVSISVGEECTACGKCVDACLMSAIDVSGERATIGDACRACGRCATACPNDAIHISIDDPDFLEKAYARIGAHVDHTTF